MTIQLLRFRVLRLLSMLLLPLWSHSLWAAAAELTVTGVIRAQEEVILRSEFPGIVQRIAVREGERVREGQVLVELKNERQKITADLARARLAKANASLAETRVLHANAQKDFDRVKIAADALPRKEYEDKADQVARLETLVDAQIAEVAQAKEELKLRENELKETQLTAPFGGAVTQIFINRGDTLKPTETQVLELVALDRLFAELLLPVSHLQDVKIGQKVRIQPDRDPSQGSLQGQVIHINPKLDAASRTFQVKVGFANIAGNAKPGMHAQISFPFPPKQ